MPNKQNNNRQAMIGLFLIVLILVGDLVTGAVSSRAPGAGGGPTVPQNTCDGLTIAPFGRTECGASSCTVLTGTSQCTGTVTFPIAFTNAPKSPTGWVGATYPNNAPTATIVVLPTSYSSWTMLSSPQTWVGMPAAQTEIFGDALAQHEIIADWGNQTQADFVLSCPTASISAGATLQIQYSNDQGATWVNIAGLSILVDGTFCGAGIPVDSCFSSSLTIFGCYVSIPVGARINNVFLRIVGSGGGGALDNPVFSQIHINTHTANGAVYRFNALQTLEVQSITTTSFTFNCKDLFAEGVNTACNMNWWAWSSNG